MAQNELVVDRKDDVLKIHQPLLAHQKHADEDQESENENSEDHDDEEEEQGGYESEDASNESDDDDATTTTTTAATRSLGKTAAVLPEHQLITTNAPVIDAIAQQEPAQQEDLHTYFRKLFRMPMGEKVVEDFYCAYYKKNMLYQGRMYISQNNVCFHSNIFGFRILLVIAFKDVTEISKQNTIGIVPNAIELKTMNQEFFFGSFMFRDHTFAILSELLKLHQRKASKPSLMEENIKTVPIVTAEENHEDNTENDGNSIHESDTSDEEEAQPETVAHPESEDDDNSDDENSKKQNTQQPEPVRQQQQPTTTSTVPIETAALDQDNTSKGPAKTNDGDASNNAPNKSDQQDNKQPNKSGSNNSGQGNNGGDDDDGDKPDDKSKPVEKKKRKSKRKVENAHDDDETADDDAWSVASDNANEFSQVPPTDIFLADNLTKPKEMFRDVYPASLAVCYKILFTNDGEMERLYHDARGDTELVLPAFEPSKDGFGKGREIRFVNQLTNPLGPKQTRVVTTQRVTLLKGRKRCLNQFSFVSLDIPYGDTFRIMAQHELTERDDNSTDIRCTLGVHFYKSSLFKWKIEETVFKEAGGSMKFWSDKAKEYIAQKKDEYQTRPKAVSPSKKSASKKTKAPEKKTRRATTAVPAKPVTAMPAPAPIVQPQIVPASKMPDTSDNPGLFMTILQTLIGFLLNLPSVLLQNYVQIPLWIFILLTAVMTLFVVPQQFKTLNTLHRVEQDMHSYKVQSARLEQELMSIILTISNVTTRKEFEDKLDKWMQIKASKDPERFVLHQLLTSTLRELEQSKQQASRLPNNAFAQQQPTGPLDAYNAQLNAVMNQQFWLLALGIVAFLLYRVFVRA